MVTIDYYTCESYTDVEILYKNVNTSKQNDISTLSVPNYKITEKLRNYLISKYKSFVSNSDKPHKPNININKIIEHIETKKVIEQANITSGDDFIERVKLLNCFYANCSVSQFGKWHIKTPEDTLHKIKLHPTTLYLGIYSNYEWLDRIIDQYVTKKPYEQLHHYSSTYRPKITKLLRKAVWGSTSMTILCYCCKDDI